jgi:hypothetical protein
MKKVKFSDKSKVILIPSRGEYAKHGLASDIWWGVEDYVYFKASARLEVMDLLDKYNGYVNILYVLCVIYFSGCRHILISFFFIFCEATYNALSRLFTSQTIKIMNHHRLHQMAYQLRHLLAIYLRVIYRVPSSSRIPEAQVILSTRRHNCEYQQTTTSMVKKTCHLPINLVCATLQINLSNPRTYFRQFRRAARGLPVIAYEIKLVSLRLLLSSRLKQYTLSL